MSRLTLSAQLALILAAAMVVSLLAVVAVDRINDVSRQKNEYLGEADSLAATLLFEHSRLSRRDFEAAVSLAQHPSNWIYYGNWDGLHWFDERDEEWESSLLALTELQSLGLDEIRVGFRSFDFVPKFTPLKSGQQPPVRRAPQLFSIRNAPRVMMHPPPRDGSPRAWVLEPFLEGTPEATEAAAYVHPLGWQPREVTVYTIALKPVDSADWIVVYKFLRPPPFGGTISLAVFSIVAGSIVAGVALLIGRRVMAPFRRLASHAELLGRGEAVSEIPIRGPKDAREIVSAFNRMNTRINQSIDYQIGLLRSLGHDLAGPLAEIGRVAGNVKPDQTRARIELCLGRVQSIVAAILSFSRAVMRDGELERTDMAALLNTIVDEQADQGADATATTPDRLIVTCRTNAIERCMRNLIDNALKYGGSVYVSLTEEDKEAVVTIDDSGPGIADDLLESAFRPFFRLSNDTEGSGLGLAIARTIIVDHGGSITLSNRIDGGLRVEVRLPI